MSLVPLYRTLDQEVLALERGASLECLVCGEFVLRLPGGVRCPECDSSLSARGEKQATQLQFGLQAG